MFVILPFCTGSQLIVLCESLDHFATEKWSAVLFEVDICGITSIKTAVLALEHCIAMINTILLLLFQIIKLYI